jgi:hypothetical protein
MDRSAMCNAPDVEVTAAPACSGNDGGIGGIAGGEPPQPAASAVRPIVLAAIAMARLTTPYHPQQRDQDYRDPARQREVRDEADQIR